MIYNEFLLPFDSIHTVNALEKKDPNGSFYVTNNKRRMLV